MKQHLRGTLLLVTMVACRKPLPAQGPRVASESMTAAASTKLSQTTRKPTTEPTPASTDLPTLDELIVLRETRGGAALLAALERLPQSPGDAFKFQERVFKLLSELNDPGAAEALVGFLSKTQHPYFETRAALALAALGDLRAVPFLARRLRRDPLEVYNPDREWEQPLQRTDNERVSAARAIADLVVIHPAEQATLLAQTEGALWFWLQASPMPHDNGLRALAVLGSKQHIEEFRVWANPQKPLPAVGALPPTEIEWPIAQLALRRVGQLHDAASFSILLSALERRPKALDSSEKGALTNNTLLLSQSLSALAQGAAQGFAELGDARALQPLTHYVQEPLNDSGSRAVAGAALGWVGSDQDLEQLAKSVARRDGVGDDAEDVLERACILEGLRVRPAQGVAAALVPMLDARQPTQLRELAALAIGRNALDRATEAKLIALQPNKAIKTQVALALLLGGSAKAATQSVASYGVNSEPAIDALTEAWSRAFAFFSTDDVANGTLLRFIRNADAVAAVELDSQAQGWAPSLLARDLKGLAYDGGPRAVTRTVLNSQLLSVARGSEPGPAQLAVRAFSLMNERGHLLELSRASGPVADAARAAYQSSSLVGPTR